MMKDNHTNPSMGPVFTRREHGTTSGYRKCDLGPCGPCRSANAAYVREYRERTRIERVPEPRAYAEPKPIAKHGITGYSAHKCRCEVCFLAAKTARDKSRAKPASERAAARREARQREETERQRREEQAVLRAEATRLRIEAMHAQREADRKARVAMRKASISAVRTVPVEVGRVRLTDLGWVYTCITCDDFHGPYPVQGRADQARGVHVSEAHT